MPLQAVFASNEQQAVGFTTAASQHGLNISRDIALITVDGTSEAAFAAPQLSTVTQQFAELAARAVALLMDPLGPRPHHVVCRFELTLRRSCGCGDPV